VLASKNKLAFCKYTAILKKLFMVLTAEHEIQGEELDPDQSYNSAPWILCTAMRCYWIFVPIVWYKYMLLLYFKYES